MVMVYPRPRGEYALAKAKPSSRTGLPPPTRGIRFRLLSPCVCPGSTPAHAGNTTALGIGIGIRRVYPRPRGEYSWRWTGKPAIAGLPPPTRGIRAHLPYGASLSRSTPAHAGNTIAAALDTDDAGVYPRPRGEYLSGRR